MAKAKLPLLSGDASGAWARGIIFLRGGVVKKYQIPRSKRTAAQKAATGAFTEAHMGFLTRAIADTLYAALAHLHDDRYAVIEHGHDHGDLDGLDDDDHTQYLTEGRADLLYPGLDHSHAVRSRSYAEASSTLNLSTSWQDVPGLTFPLPVGEWCAMAILDSRIGTGTQNILGRLLVAGSETGKRTVLRADGAILWGTVAQQWHFTLTETSTIKVQAQSNPASTPVATINAHSTLMAW